MKASTSSQNWWNPIVNVMNARTVIYKRWVLASRSSSWLFGPTVRISSVVVTIAMQCTQWTSAKNYRKFNSRWITAQLSSDGVFYIPIFEDKSVQHLLSIEGNIRLIFFGGLTGNNNNDINNTFEGEFHHCITMILCIRLSKVNTSWRWVESKKVFSKLTHLQTFIISRWIPAVGS